MRSILPVISLGVALCAAAPASANLIANGSFEMPVLESTYQNHQPGANTLTGWEILGSPGEAVSQVRSDFAGNPGYSFPAQDGDYWLDLAGFVSNAPDAVSQSIATVIGTSYDFSFYVGNITGVYFGTQTSIGVEFSSGGTNFSCTNTQGTTTMVWQLCSTSFVATAANTSITLRSLDGPSDYSAAIDNVSLVTSPPVDSAVPENSTWALLVGGFGLVGATLRRSRRTPQAI